MLVLGRRVSKLLSPEGDSFGTNGGETEHLPLRLLGPAYTLLGATLGRPKLAIVASSVERNEIP
jgi:hypothetical protein